MEAPNDVWIRIQLTQEYAPVFNRKKGGLKNKNLDLDMLRLAGSKSVDIWADGSLYPLDPLSGKKPSFRDVSSLVRFCGDGNSGLLGYCERLREDEGIRNRIQFLEMSCFRLSQENYNLNQQLFFLSLHYSTLMKERNDGLGRETSLRYEVDKSKLVIGQLQEKIQELERANFGLQCRLKNLKKTPLGLRERKKHYRPIEELKFGSGAFRRRVTATRSVYNTSKGQLRSGETRSNLGYVVKNLVTNREIVDMICQPYNSPLKKMVLEMVLGEIYKKLEATDVQTVCDDVGISRLGYRSLFKPFHEALKRMGTKKVFAPRPQIVENTRVTRTKMVYAILGEMHHVECAGPAIAIKDKKGKDCCDIVGMNERNNLWVDLVTLLQFLVKYYDLTVAETNGEIEVCIKLDEMELTKFEKYERVSVVIMNRAIENAIAHAKSKSNKNNKKDVEVTDEEKKRAEKWFSCQSEDDTWWLGLFKVQKETHEVLKWVFNQTDIPSLISRFEGGEKLQVDHYGSYKVIFHLASDLKTEKAMYNISGGGQGTCKSCLYCNHARKSSTGKTVSTLSLNQANAPNRGEEDPKFHGIFPIPLERVHICTLHGFVRIIDKMIFLSCRFVWNISDKKRREEGIRRVEHVLSEAGLHGGNVRLELDEKRAGRTSVPRKVSIGGVKARRFIKNHREALNGNQMGEKVYEFGKLLVDAEQDRTDGVRSALRKKKAWDALSELFPYIQRMDLTREDAEMFVQANNKFIKAFIDAWGESEVTHYLHIFWAHAPWFFRKYGSLAVWSAQGMEKSHKQAKIAFHRNTQRGGGNVGTNPLRQMTEWFYRRAMAKYDKKVALRSNPEVVNTIGIMLKRKRKVAWQNSRAPLASQQWRSKRQRIGKVYL